MIVPLLLQRQTLLWMLGLQLHNVVLYGLLQAQHHLQQLGVSALVSEAPAAHLATALIVGVQSGAHNLGVLASTGCLEPAEKKGNLHCSRGNSP